MGSNTNSIITTGMSQPRLRSDRFLVAAESKVKPSMGEYENISSVCHLT